ncbi:efflux RND transporter periplasmic adaptor subunit [Chryseolinea lacunae]|uniref:Efflux RND transporter periplasmic adaptor subunit n=1 Tax=Chryseolinea lacunae TaxID=2801331 RepID=A0ABS1KPD0_9BACT|nr:efflux RND transporter periplasmic adaptor subunit [Chryseolinea lacunae]MBL0741318.1 efflux RND transporter periplasmic adaptor subunit [Chryseolinea lacunae]
MKSTIYTRFVVIVAAGILVACSAASPDDKKAELTKLKQQQADIGKQILKLETEIAKANPDSVTVRAKEVNVTELAARKFDYFVQTQGSVDAEDNIQVSSKAMGVITAVFVKEGDAVSKGQTLAQIDNSVIQRNIEGMRSQLDLANTVFERQKNLWAQKIGTEVQYLQAKTNKESLEKQLESIQEQNSQTRITAPFSGTVDEVTAKIGQNIAPGMPAVRIVNTSNLKLKAKVSEAYVTEIKKGNKVVVSIPELKKEISATVTFVGKSIDPLSRTFPVEVKLPSEANLRPNMTGVIKVIFHTEPNAITVPVNVVQNINNEKVVFVYENDGKNAVARKKVVTVDGVYDNLAQVQGLKAGDKIISFGYQGLNDGQVIKTN